MSTSTLTALVECCFSVSRRMKQCVRAENGIVYQSLGDFPLLLFILQTKQLNIIKVIPKVLPDGPYPPNYADF